MLKFLMVIMICSSTLLSAIVIKVKNTRGLYKALRSSATDLNIILKPGTYKLTPISVTDSTLGNAVDPDSMITVTTGLHLVGKNIQLIGTNRRKTIIKTNAGYGIFIEHCPEVLIKNLTITGGVRDQDGNATSGAIVVKNSHTEITGCIIENNQGDFSQTIAGICGIVGREGSNLNINNNVIRDNSWDGIALYRKAIAKISNNLIYNGRGAGIGITWDSRARVRFNVIHHYWKGIGTFGKSWATLNNNLVRDVRGWGIIASGESSMSCNNNEVRRCGNAGFAVWDSTASMDIFNNVICQNGTEKQWVAPLVGIWLASEVSKVDIIGNLFWDNDEADIGVGYKEPGLGDAAFTFAYKTERFNNTKFRPTPPTVNQGNYFTTRPDTSSDISKGVINPKPGIMWIPPYESNWTWDPDKEPFED